MTLYDEIDGWRFDVPTGVYFNDTLSAEVLRRAEKIAGRQAVQLQIKGDTPTIARVEPLKNGDGYKITQNDRNEYGCAFKLPVNDTALSPLVNYLAKLLQKIDLWLVLPHLRRSDDSYYQCECGAVFKLPGGFDLKDFGRAEHNKLWPDHRLTFVVRPSEYVAFYGIGFGPVKNGPEPLREDRPIPVKAS